jgi:hypothetical protein
MRHVVHGVPPLLTGDTDPENGRTSGFDMSSLSSLPKVIESRPSWLASTL